MSMRLSRSIVGEAEAEAVRRVIVEDGYLGMGHETCLFEQELAAYLGVAPGQVVTTNTGTAALTLAVDAIAPRDAARKPQILVPSLTFVASFQAIVAAGGAACPGLRASPQHAKAGAKGRAKGRPVRAHAAGAPPWRHRAALPPGPCADDAHTRLAPPYDRAYCRVPGCPCPLLFP